MPTTRHRYQVTETDDVAAALEHARERWPEDAERPNQLLQRLISLADALIEEETGERRERRRRVAEETAGCLTGTYPPDAIEKLHREWPA